MQVIVSIGQTTLLILSLSSGRQVVQSSESEKTLHAIGHYTTTTHQPTQQLENFCGSETFPPSHSNPIPCDFYLFPKLIKVEGLRL